MVHFHGPCLPPLRVFSCLASLPLSLSLSGGFAVRREDGLGGWPPVHSSFWFSSTVRLASVASGFMPFWISPSTRPGSVWWSPAASQACRPWWTEAVGSGSGTISLPLIILRSSQISRIALCSSLLFQVTLVVDEEQGCCRYMKLAGRVRAYQQGVERRRPWLAAGLRWLAASSG